MISRAEGLIALLEFIDPKIVEKLLGNSAFCMTKGDASDQVRRLYRCTD